MKYGKNSEFEVKFFKSAVEDLKRLSKEMLRRIKKKISEIKSDPYKSSERLRGARMYKARVGDYRIIFEINENLREIRVLMVGHRRNIYKRFHRKFKDIK